MWFARDRLNRHLQVWLGFLGTARQYSIVAPCVWALLHLPTTHTPLPFAPVPLQVHDEFETL